MFRGTFPEQLLEYHPMAHLGDTPASNIHSPKLPNFSFIQLWVVFGVIYK
jgi:hypothetical protein